MAFGAVAIRAIDYYPTQTADLKKYLICFFDFILKLKYFTESIFR
jgi:hypothetical protein